MGSPQTGGPQTREALLVLLSQRRRGHVLGHLLLFFSLNLSWGDLAPLTASFHETLKEELISSFGVASGAPKLVWDLRIYGAEV